MIRKYHNHTLQTNSLHRKGEAQYTNSHTISGRQLKKKPSIPHQDDCKTRKRHKVLHNKSRDKHRASTVHRTNKKHETAITEPPP